MAPLTLQGVGIACYDLLVESGAGTVWSRGSPSLTRLGADQRGGTVTGAPDGDTICSDLYGNGAGGDITYIGTCDAESDSDGTLANGVQNTVTLWIDGLYDAAGTADLGAWRDPCPDGCALEVACGDNEDSMVEFNLTVLRQANQGFFDVAVNFEDVFCSAKLDTCYPNATATHDDDEHIELLFGGDATRDWTAVFGLACTAGTETDVTTTLMYGAVTVTCGATVFTIDPRAEPGNAEATAAGHVLHYGIYRGTEALACGPGRSCNKAYWNLAFDLADLSTLGGCTLGLRATASGGTGFVAGVPTTAGLAYPYVAVDAALTTPSGAGFCQANGLDVGATSEVETVYHGDIEPLTPAPVMCSTFVGGAVAATGGVGCPAAVSPVRRIAGPGAAIGDNGGWSFQSGGVLDPWIAAVTDDANFGPGGVVPHDVSVTALQSLAAEDLEDIDVFVSTWWYDTSSAPYVDMIVDWFLAGGDLVLLQDDTGVDAIGEALGVPTIDIGEPTVTGSGPLFAGPFGTAGTIYQTGNFGTLDGTAVATLGGTVAATNGNGDAVVALWPAGAYALGAGRLVVTTDIDLITTGYGVATYTPLNGNGIFGLNLAAFVIAP